jgi:cell cycle protein kinase DBF2
MSGAFQSAARLLFSQPLHCSPTSDATDDSQPRLLLPGRRCYAAPPA